jgi:signal transduction histidine kinase
LNVIAGYAQALRAKMWGDVTAEQNEVLGKILQESENLTVIVNEVLDVTRIEAGELVLQRETFSLSDYLWEIQNKFAPSQESVSLHWVIPDGLPKISTDRATLTVILRHLIDNALKFTANGDIWVTARTASSRQSVEIEVKDTGIGIPREAHHLIFEKFQQVDPSSTRTYGGLGLGLYIVRVFTDLLEGTLKVESEPRQGSTFTLCLPI